MTMADTAKRGQRDISAGDVNNDKSVNVVDPILAFKIAAGTRTSSPVIEASDVKGEGVIGIEEDLYILRA